MSKRLVVYVEGQTEELFVTRILRGHLLAHGIIVERPILARTSNSATGQRGGFVNWPAVEADLRVIFSQESDPDVRFTTLLDVYALPRQVPGFTPSTGGHRSPAEVDLIESAWANHFGELRFIPYLQRHEFEALVLAHPPALRAVFSNFASAISILESALPVAGSAEDINDGPTTHPSARLAQAIQTYPALKASHAFWVIAEAGLDNIRPRCPRFDAWLQWLENWGAS
jgi:hypothetical protein